jgi:mRNA-degrading endonuclease RelE of RelBE toxin-antitoxin system
MRQIVWKKRALRQLRKIRNQADQRTIYAATSSLAVFPDCENIKKIKTTDMFRLRVGRWRVIFTESLEIITIEEVRKRDERTYR